MCKSVLFISFRSLTTVGKTLKSLKSPWISHKLALWTLGSYIVWTKFCDPLTFPKTMPTLFLCLLVLSADNLWKQLDPDQTWQNAGPDLDLNCLTLWWYSWKNSSKKLIVKKINRQQKAWKITQHAQLNPLTAR